MNKENTNWPEVVLEERKGRCFPMKIIRADGKVKKELITIKTKHPNTSFMDWVIDMSDDQLEAAIVIARDKRIWEDDLSSDKYEVLVAARKKRLRSNAMNSIYESMAHSIREKIDKEILNSLYHQWNDSQTPLDSNE